MPPADDISSAIATRILDELPMGLLFCDLQGVIRYLNDAYANLLDVKPKMAIGKPITAFIPHSRAYEVMEKGEPELGDFCQLGRTHPVIVNRIPVKNESGTVIGMISHAIFNDLDDLHKLSARIERLDRKVSHYKKRFQASLASQHTFASILGESESIARLKRQATSYAHLDEPILILGETGSGKELFAHAIHAESPRSKGPLVCINCASIPRELFESELFGYEKGAFSGGRNEGKIGQIELADKGTLFLDEIGDMPPEIQAKLLRVLETRAISRLGGIGSKRVDFRLLAATNRDLAAMIERGAFREDLYYRVNTFILEIPPLRERPEDIAPIAFYTLKRMELEFVTFASETMSAMRKFAWPGNARQLRNAIIHAATMRKSNTLFPDDFPQDTLPSLNRTDAEAADRPLAKAAARSEAQAIRQALAETGRNVAKAARMLNISRATLYTKMTRYAINPRDPD